MQASRTSAAVICLVGFAQGACYSAPPTPSTDFANSVLVLSSANMFGGNPVDVNVFLQRKNGELVQDSIVQVEAADCDVTQPTAPSDPNGQSTGSVVEAAEGLHMVNATVTAGAQQVALPFTTTLLTLPLDAQDPNAVQAGVPLSMQAIARRKNGRINTLFSGQAHFVTSDPAATLPDDSPMDKSYHGVRVWPAGVVLRTKGQQVVQVVDSDTGALLASEQFTVVDGPIGKLTFVSAPVSVTAGQAFTAKIAVESPSGGLLQTYTGSVAFTSSDANSTLPQGYTFATSDAGARTFSFTLTRAGNQRLQITDGIVVSSVLVNVQPGPAAGFQVTGIDNPATAGYPYTPTLTAVDAYGNVAVNYTGTASISSSDSGASLPGSVSFGPSNAGSVALGPTTLSSPGTTSLTAATMQGGLQTTTNLLVHKVMGFTRQVAEQEGYGVSCAIIDTGLLKCWGYNSNGNLGYGDTLARGAHADSIGASLPPVNLGTGRLVRQVSSGTEHTCAVLDDGTVKCWGNNSDGQLGVGDLASRGDLTPDSMGDNLPAVDLGTGRTATRVTLGARHTCALLDNGSVKCWGRNDVGELGLGDTRQRGAHGTMGTALPAVNLGSSRTAQRISAGSYHTCALLDDTTVKCWGFNNVGQLGVGDTANRGDSGNMSSLPAVNLGSGRTAVAVSAGGYHSCALLDDQSLKCWGFNGQGQLGLGDTGNRGDSSANMGSNLPNVNLGSGRVAAVSASLRFTCALLSDGTVRCWGTNISGELGLGDVNNRGDTSASMGDNLPAINLGTGRTVIKMSTSVSHTCVQLDVGTVRCWGDNSYGQLGTGQGLEVGQKPNDMGDGMAPSTLW